jgi:hypothetical protein
VFKEIAFLYIIVPLLIRLKRFPVGRGNIYVFFTIFGLGLRNCLSVFSLCSFSQVFLCDMSEVALCQSSRRLEGYLPCITC